MEERERERERERGRGQTDSESEGCHAGCRYPLLLLSFPIRDSISIPAARRLHRETVTLYMSLAVFLRGRAALGTWGQIIFTSLHCDVCARRSSPLQGLLKWKHIILLNNRVGARARYLRPCINLQNGTASPETERGFAS